MVAIKEERAKIASLESNMEQLKTKYDEAVLRLSPKYIDMLHSAENICAKIVRDGKQEAFLFKQKTERELKSSREELENNRSEAQNFRNQYRNDQNRLTAIETLIHKPASNVSLSWLSEQYAAFDAWSTQQVQDYLDICRRAHTAAETVSSIKNQKRAIAKQLAFYRIRVSYYERMFPFLCDQLDEEKSMVPQESISSNSMNKADLSDEAGRWLSPEEYERLSEIERNQLALDRYKSRVKTNWEVGRDFESFIGHGYSKEGYSVEYVGILRGLEDLGRDLICRKNGTTLIVQCKRWRHDVQIHEKHINQLVGTTIEYALRNGGTLKLGRFMISSRDQLLENNTIIPVFVTTASLSETAKEFAKSLGVHVREIESVGDFPMIKCNVSNVNQTKIYHLPFDQQYNRTIIEPHRGEFYASTVKEAIDAGFRRARRYHYRWPA